MAIIIVNGVVQGVGFRPTVYRVAKEMGLKGYVKNTGSNVEIAVDKEADTFIQNLIDSLPPLASIYHYEILEDSGVYNDFIILPSSTGKRDTPIPPDTAICDDCLRELKTQSDRRWRFPFINCTNCGARFSVIYDLPYDRFKTSMDDFVLCETCEGEYRDPEDRRFHAQTISCHNCGPKYRIHDSDSSEPIKDFARSINDGQIGAIKSWAGTHIVCLPSQVEKLRERFNRTQKPLAVMVQSIEAARKYARISKHEHALLMSHARPIVLLDKNSEELAETAPGLDKIGIYLAYNGLHHMLFRELDHDSLIMTSGNIPGEPMAVTDEEVLSLAADIFLLHDRRIVNRTDDSVVLPYKNGQLFIRRSRGYVPEPIPIGHDKTLVAVGADMNGTGAISINGKAIMTQHIGDISHYGTAEFLQGALKHLMGLYGIEKVDGVVMDLHPRYYSRGVGKRLAEELAVPTIEVQHHAAHAYALMAEHNLDNLRVLSCDGTGYGTDGTVWGGEVIDVGGNGHKRIGHLRYLPLLGGEKAVEDPRRVVFAISKLLGTGQPYFSGQDEVVLEAMMDKSIQTSSTGRVLDALSCWLGICERMTYDGEPAMKLEPYLRKGKPRFDFTAPVKDGVVDTLALFGQLDEQVKPGEKLERSRIADISRSFVDALFEGLVNAAKGTDVLGFSGGVSYNLVINDILQTILTERGIKFITHRVVPNGDGGVSFGQLIGGGIDVLGNSR